MTIITWCIWINKMESNRGWETAFIFLVPIVFSVTHLINVSLWWVLDECPRFMIIFLPSCPANIIPYSTRISQQCRYRLWSSVVSNTHLLRQTSKCSSHIEPRNSHPVLRSEQRMERHSELYLCYEMQYFKIAKFHWLRQRGPLLLFDKLNINLEPLYEWLTCVPMLPLYIWLLWSTIQTLLSDFPVIVGFSKARWLTINMTTNLQQTLCV